MTIAHRDLSSPDLWERSLERSRYRRALLPGARRWNNRRKGIAAAMSAATMAGPGTPLAFAQLSSKPEADLGAETSSKRAIEVREGGLPLRLGSQGALVAQVQKALSIAPDGIFGPQTDVAVRRYQDRAGVKVDGIVGPVTWAALFPATSAARGGDAPPAVKERLERELRVAGARLEQRTTKPRGGLFGSNGDKSGAKRSNAAPPASGDDAKSEPPADGPEADSGPGSPPAEEQNQSPDAEREQPSPVNTSCGSSTLSSPVKGTVTSGFGPRWGRNHDGLDIAASAGTAIRAAACGSVTIAGVQDGYGNIVCITHSSSFSTCYAHMSRFAVSQGARVRAGQVIGYVGCTGSCTGPHVHFETRVDGQAQDPTPYLNGSRAASASAASRATTRLDAAAARTSAAMSTGGGAAASGGASAPQASWSESAGTSVASESAAIASGDTGQISAVPTTSAEAGTPAAPVYAAPVEPVAAPVPVEPVAAPVPVEPVAAPVEPVAAPVPVEPVAEPVPVEPVVAPVEPVVAPVEPVAEPVAVDPVAEAVPVEPVAAPVEPVAAPVEPVAAAPVETAPAPVESTPAPAEPPVVPAE